MTTENNRDLTAEFEGENGRVLAQEKLLRGVLYGDVEKTEDGYIADGELYTPVSDKG